MPESRRDRLRAAVKALSQRTPSSPSPDERREPESASALQITPLSAPEEESPSAHHQLKLPYPPSALQKTPLSASEEQPPSVYHRLKSPHFPPLTPSPLNRALQTTPENYGLFIFGERRPPEDYNLDIVAVHGLGGHWEKTWTDTNGKLWLRDFLPSQLPRARIMSYGYNSAVFAQAVSGINGEAGMLLDRLNVEREGEKTRPIIFISHSLGGIIVEKAMIMAHERSSVYGGLLNNVRGSVFFGVPHRGASVANFAANILKIIPLESIINTSFIASLMENSVTFDDISQQFIERAAPLMIRTFYETEGLDGLLIVDRDSARLGLPNEIAVGIAGTNHRTVCKFHDIDSEKYSPVWVAIKMMSDSVGIDSAAFSVYLSGDEVKCLQSLYISDYGSHRLRVPPAIQGTCTWFLRHEKYTAWRAEQESSLLWVSADPGCGKSVLSSFLVEMLRSAESQAALPGTVCFFFFRDDNDEQKSAVFALCALLHQLFVAKPTLIPHALADFKSKGQKLTRELNTLWKIFTKAATDSGNVICVIDGLDECEKLTQSVLINSLVKFYSNRGTSKGHLKIILTSRPYASIAYGFHDLPRIRLRGEDETNAVSTDVELIISHRVKRLGSRWSLPEHVQANLQASLTKGADRTLLWVSLILGILENTPKASEREFNEIINNPPADLDAVYEKILRSGPDPEGAKTILHIIVAAARPLTLGEMNVALAIQPHHKSIKDLESDLIPPIDLESDLIPPIEQFLKELCGLFIRIIDSNIYLVHQTAREFLVNDSSTDDPSPGTWKHALRPAESNLVVAHICISYLLFVDFEVNPLVLSRGPLPTVCTEVDLYTSEHVFLDYAAKNWAAHFREAQTDDLGLLKSVLEVCGSGSRRFRTWFQVYWVTANPYSQFPQGLTDLMVASYLGIEEVVKLLLGGRRVNVNEQNTRYGSALNMAAFGKNHGVVQLLLDKGANFYLPEQECIPSSEIQRQITEDGPVVSAVKRALGENHPGIGEAMDSLVFVYRSQGRGKEAVDLEVQINAMKETADGGLQLGGRVSDFEDNISILSDSDSSYASTSLFSNFSGSSNTTVPSVLQRFIEKVEDDIATVLTSTCTSEVTIILSGAVQKQSQTTVNRRLSRALREFSADVRKLQTTKKLSQDELSILRSIRNQDTLDSIALRISRVFVPKTDNLRHDNLRNLKQLSNQELVDLLDHQSSDANNPIESDESDESEGFDGEEEPAGPVGSDLSIGRIIDYFKSREVLEIFERIVVKRFTRVRRKPQSKQNAHDECGGTIQGITLVLGDAKSVRRSPWPAKFSAGKTDISFEIGRRWSLLNQAKGWIEGLFGEPINWWPLESRRHPLPEGFIWATWKCRCGERVSSAISEERRNQYNQWIYAAKRACTSPNAQTTPATIEMVPAAARAPPGNPQIVSTVISPQTPSALGSTSTPAASAPLSTTDDPERDGGKDKDKHLLWCINLGSDTVVSNLVVSQDDNDTKIFLKLKNEYRKVRSWRIFFSLYSISEIKFVRFRCFLTRYASCDRDPALPGTDHQHYEYQPRPVEDMPPIPPQQLMMFFRKPPCAGDSEEVVNAFPKKLNGEMSSDEKHGWGLHACEHFSFIRAFLLFLFIQAFFLGFFIYWIRNHTDDFQNATTLWALSLSLISALALFLKTSN